MSLLKLLFSFLKMLWLKDLVAKCMEENQSRQGLTQGPVELKEPWLVKKVDKCRHGYP